MKNFTYYRPKSEKEAVALLDKTWGKVELLAGGTDLLDLQKEYIAQPDKVVSLKGLPNPGQFYGSALRQDDSVVVGAGTTLADIAKDPGFLSQFPALLTAAGDVGGPQIRNMGTLGGNLCQRNRCWYFRDDEVNCLLKGGDKCFALDGDNRYHAIFTKSQKCVIVHPSTLAPPLIALGATAQVFGPGGKTRDIKMEDFYHAPTSPAEREHVLAPNEMVVSVIIPHQEGNKNASYEVRHKQAYDWPLVQAAVAFNLVGGKAKDVRIVLGHVAPTPLLSAAAAKALEGKAVTEETAAAAGAEAAKGANPLSQNAYKVKLVSVAVKRAILTAAGGKKYWEV